MSYIGKINIDSSGTSLPIGSTLYGEATSASSSGIYTANSGELANVDTLLSGLTIHVKFNQVNSVENPKLKVGSTDAKAIQHVVGTSAGTTAATSWPANSIVTLTYDGQSWVINSDSDTVYTFSEGSVNGTFDVSVNGGSATSVAIHGLGTAAYTSTGAYATSAQGAKADAAMPTSGGTFTGNVNFSSGTTLTMSSGTTLAVSSGAVLTVNEPSENNQAANKKYVDDSFASAMGANNAMLFKGTIGSTAGATISALPTPNQGYRAGWTYRVVGTSGYSFDTNNCEDGDIIIAIADASGDSSAINPADWTVAQANIDGAVYVSSTSASAGDIAVFSDTNTLTNGPQITSSGSGFLRENGSWTTFSGANPISIEYENNTLTFSHSSGITAKTSANASGDTTLNWDSAFTLYEELYNEYGHITGITSYTLTMPSNPNTDSMVEQTGITENSEYPILFKSTTGLSSITSAVHFGMTSGKEVTINPATGFISAGGFIGAISPLNLTGTDSTATGAVFLHQNGNWETPILTQASVSSGVLMLGSMGITIDTN